MPVFRHDVITAPFELKDGAGVPYFSEVRPRFITHIEGDPVQKRTGWKLLSQPAKSAPLNYFRFWSQENRNSDNQFNYRSYAPYDDESFTGSQTGPLGDLFAYVLNTDLMEDARYRAKAKLFERLRGEGANIANMFGERKQVANTVANAVNTIIYTIRDLKRLNFRSAVRRMGGDPLSARKLRGKDIADQWLSLQYGWKPLLSDVFDLIEGSHLREKNLPKVIKSSAQKEVSKVPTLNKSWTIDAQGVCHGTYTETARCGYTVRVFPDSVLAEPAALGVTNPLTVAWEVTPWSFVVDWFLPVGKYIEQWSSTHGWRFQDGSTWELHSNSTAAAFSSTSIIFDSGIKFKLVSDRAGSSTYTKFSRSVISDFPIPDVPRFKNPVSFMHVANSIALLAQVVTGGSRWKR